ncbi:MAG: hypothetical protein IJ002_02065 [Clostridia bacterium]|nr:hypothetical protein [Clostridia bacterium]
MSLLKDLMDIVSRHLPTETAIYNSTAETDYAVLTPLSDTFGFHSDNRPNYDVQAVQISMYTKGNYRIVKNQIIRDLLNADITITGRRFIGYESDTGFYHYAIEVEKYYELEE